MLLKCIVLFRVYNKVQLNPSLQYIEPIPLKVLILLSKWNMFVQMNGWRQEPLNARYM